MTGAPSAKSWPSAVAVRITLTAVSFASRMTARSVPLPPSVETTDSEDGRTSTSPGSTPLPPRMSFRRSVTSKNPSVNLPSGRPSSPNRPRTTSLSLCGGSKVFRSCSDSSAFAVPSGAKSGAGNGVTSKSTTGWAGLPASSVMFGVSVSSAMSTFVTGKSGVALPSSTRTNLSPAATSPKVVAVPWVVAPSCSATWLDTSVSAPISARCASKLRRTFSALT